MPGKLTATECRSMFAGAGAPDGFAEHAEAAGWDLNSLWTLYTTVAAVIANPAMTNGQKAWAILKAIVTAFANPQPVPPGPVAPGKPS